MGEPTPTGQGPAQLASALAPVLRESCGGRLSEVQWFRSDWQRGGAATGYATFDFEDGPREVVVKLPVGPVEHRFTTALSATGAPTPRVAAHGLELGGYDLAWLVMERLPGDPMSAAMHREVFAEVCAACASFQKHAGEGVPLDAGAARAGELDWEGLIDRARHAVKDSRIPNNGKWNDLLKHAQRVLPRLLNVWHARAIDTWRHGDLHPGNAMRRPEGSAWGEPGCVLLDLAEVQAGHWVEDAVYLERMQWGRLAADGGPLLQGIKMVSLFAKARKAIGLACEDDYGTLGNVRRALTAASVPAFLDREGSPAHLETARETLERMLSIVGK